MRRLCQLGRLSAALLLLVFVAIPVAASPRAYSLHEFQSEAIQAVNKGGHESLTKVMRKYGWSPMTLHEDKGKAASKEIGTAAVGRSSLSLRMYAFHNDRRPRQFAVYSAYNWGYATETRPASEDVLGIDWLNSSLQPLGTGASSTDISYTGDSPTQQVVAFTLPDPRLRKRTGTAWVVLQAPSSITNGTRLSFNTRFDHTYETTRRTETWAANLTWDPNLTGTLSYTVELQETEDRWRKGTLWYCTWPCG